MESFHSAIEKGYYLYNDFMMKEVFANLITVLGGVSNRDDFDRAMNKRWSEEGSGVKEMWNNAAALGLKHPNVLAYNWRVEVANDVTDSIVGCAVVDDPFDEDMDELVGLLGEMNLYGDDEE